MLIGGRDINCTSSMDTHMTGEITGETPRTDVRQHQLRLAALQKCLPAAKPCLYCAHKKQPERFKKDSRKKTE